MFKSLVVFVTILGSAGIANAQSNPVPTVLQCRADEATWLSYFPNRVVDISYKTLDSWAMEMDDCVNVDFVNAQKYSTTEGMILETMGTRAIRFIVRHHTVDQFLQEDDGGAR
jgi:hypothetical protein